MVDEGLLQCMQGVPFGQSLDGSDLPTFTCPRAGGRSRSLPKRELRLTQQARPLQMSTSHIRVT